VDRAASFDSTISLKLMIYSKELTSSKPKLIIMNFMINSLPAEAPAEAQAENVRTLTKVCYSARAHEIIFSISIFQFIQKFMTLLLRLFLYYKMAVFSGRMRGAKWNLFLVFFVQRHKSLWRCIFKRCTRQFGRPSDSRAEDRRRSILLLRTT